MVVYENVLSDETIELFRENTLSKFGSQCWAFSSSTWGEEVLKGVVGECMSSLVDDELKNKILGEIGHLLPKCSSYMLQQYIWGKNSGVSKHNDGTHKFGATIYMNKYWDVNYGGVFLWRKPEEPDSSMKVIVPSFNTMVLNNDKNMHMVTSISSIAPDYRVTLQIWGDDV